MVDFEVAEISGETVFSNFKNIRVVYDFCQTIDPKRKVCLLHFKSKVCYLVIVWISKEIRLKSGKMLPYDKLCLAMGGKPKVNSLHT